MALPYLSGWRYRALLLSITLAMVGYLGFSIWAGWGSVTQALSRVGVLGILLVLLLSLTNYALRFWRWQLYLRVLDCPVPHWPSLKVYLAGFALTTTPGKTGEALRSLLLKPWQVPYLRSFAAFFSERLSDLLAMALLTLFGLTLYPGAYSDLALLSVLVVMALLLLSRQGLVERALCFLEQLGEGRFSTLARRVLLVLREARHCHQPQVLWQATLLATLAWAAEAVALYSILCWMGIDLPLSFVAFVYALGVLGGVLSVMPGGLGGTEVVMTGLLIWRGVAEADAVAAVILIRLATLWFAVGLGLIFLSRCAPEEAKQLSCQPL